MQETFSNFLDIVNIVLLFPNIDCTQIMHLASGCGIECTPVEKDNVGSLLLVLNILQYSYNLGIKLV